MAQHKVGKLNIPTGIPAGGIHMGGSPKSMAEIMFEKFDTDKTGYLDQNEFQLLCRNMGYAVSQHECQLALKTLDLDGNGQLSLSEFKKWWANPDRWSELHVDDKQLQVRQNASETFKAYDHDNKGVIKKNNFSNFHDDLKKNKLTTKDEAGTFADLDKDGNGVISYSEYVEWLARNGDISVKVMPNSVPNVKLKHNAKK